MICPRSEIEAWNWRRWAFFSVIIFLGQILFLVLLSPRAPRSARNGTPHAKIFLFPKPLAQSQFTEQFLAGDPTLFVLPKKEGFSGPAWLTVPPRNYDLKEQTEPSFWLPLDADKLGNAIARHERVKEPLFAFPTLLPTVLLPVLSETNHIRSTSFLRIEGELATREIIRRPTLKVWNYTNVLSNSIAQIGVDERGLVVSTRLLGRSGLAEADRAALEIARKLRFGQQSGNLMWGNIIFGWHTIPSASNAAERAKSP